MDKKIYIIKVKKFDSDIIENICAYDSEYNAKKHIESYKDIYVKDLSSAIWYDSLIIKELLFLDTGYNYIGTATPILNGDMVILDDRNIGFVWFNKRKNKFEVKYYKDKPIVDSLENMHEHIAGCVG